MDVETASGLRSHADARGSRAGWRAWVGRAATVSEAVAGTAMVFAMLLTGADIVGRLLGRPIPGTYEVVSFAGGLIVGLAMPATARANAHVVVDLLTTCVPARVAWRLSLATRVVGIAVLLLMAWGIVGVGDDLRASGEVSSVLALPFWPIAYGMAGAFALSCLCMVAAFAASEGGSDE